MPGIDIRALILNKTFLAFAGIQINGQISGVKDELILNTLRMLYNSKHPLFFVASM